MVSSKKLWDKARGVVPRSVGVVCLLLDYLRGWQGMIAERLDIAFLQVDFL
jgi:hypothetical protein